MRRLCAAVLARLALLAVACASAGCLFTPSGVQVALGGAVRQESTSGSAPADVPFQLRAAVHPLQLAPQTMLHRRADFGVGYVLDTGSAGLVEGGYVEGSYVFLQGRGNPLGRLSLRGQGRVLVDDRQNAGGGAAVQLTGEWGGDVGPDASGGSGRHGSSLLAIDGEATVGFYVESAFATFADRSLWTGGVGLIVRTPFFFLLALPK